MKKQIAAIIIAVGILSSCESGSQKLVNNKTFSQDETKELLALIKKFDKAICELEDKDLENVEECYKSFGERIWQEIQEGTYSIGITKGKQDEILSELNEELRNQIWFYGRGIINRRFPVNSKNLYPDTVTSVSLNQNKYFKFLKEETTGINANTKNYFEKLEALGDISPSMFADVAENYSKYTTSDERAKLLYVIHYLTLNQNNLIENESYERLKKELME